MKSCVDVGLVLILMLSACAELPRGIGFINESHHVAYKDLSIQSPARLKMTGFDVYIDDEIVHVVATAISDRNNKKSEIFYFRSDDEGLSWSIPVQVTKQIDVPVISRLGNDAQIAASGNHLLISWETSGEIPSSGPLLSARSVDAGHSWQLAASLVGNNAEQSHADIVVDNEGSFNIVWLDDREENGYQGLRYAKALDSAGTWSVENTVDATTCSCCWNRLFVNRHGMLNVLYRNMEYRDMAIAQLAQDSAKWDVLSSVGVFNWKFDGCPHNGGGIAQGGNGVLHSSIWTGVEHQQGLYYVYSDDDGSHWSAPLLVDKEGFHSDIAAMDDHAAMVWDKSSDSGTAVFFRESQNNGQEWSKSTLLSSALVSASFPRIVATKQGWFVLWMQQEQDGVRSLMSAMITR